MIIAGGWGIKGNYHSIFYLNLKLIKFGAIFDCSKNELKIKRYE